MSSNNIEFRVPATENPTIRGTNSSEFETFKMNETNSLVREEVQNSLDVIDAEGGNGVTKMDICLYDIEKEDIPCHKEFEQMFQDNEQYWHEKVTDKKTEAFFNGVNKALIPKTMRCMRISDYNNTGLSRDRIDGRCSPWESMTLGEGVSDKASGSGGSHGLGKNAAYTTSALRTVMYETINREGDALTMGVVKAPSYRKNNKHHDGYGFFCDKNSKEYEPVKYVGLDKSFDRAGRIGTDKHILAYNADETEQEIEDKITIAALNSFFVALAHGRLEINCNNCFEISKDTLDELMSKYEIKEGGIDRTSYNQYQTMKNPDKVFTLSIFEDHDVVIYFRQHPEGARRACVVRRTGMKIFDQKNFPSGIMFDAVIHIVGAKANDFFKQFENGEHNAWKISDIRKNSEHKKYYDMLFDPLRNVIKECQEALCGDAIDAEGVSDFLPDAYIETKRISSKNKNQKTKDTLTNEIESTQKTKAKKTKREKVERTYVAVDEDGTERVETHETTSAYNACGNRENHTKGRPGLETPVVEPSVNGFGISNAGDNHDPEKDYFAVGKKIESKNYSVKLKNNGNGFKMILNSQVGFEEGFVEVKISGETISGVAKIKSATVDGITVDVSKSKDKFKIKDIGALSDKEINIDIDSSEKLAVEVYLYENTRK